jgi:hypothetical protein
LLRAANRNRALEIGFRLRCVWLRQHQRDFPGHAIAFLGLLLAVILLIGSFFISWSVAVFPSWVFLISVYILIDNLRGNPLADGG